MGQVFLSLRTSMLPYQHSKKFKSCPISWLIEVYICIRMFCSLCFLHSMQIIYTNTFQSIPAKVDSLINYEYTGDFYKLNTDYINMK